MKNLTTPQAVLGGLALIALAIASIPYSSSIVTPAHANEDRVQKVVICDANDHWYCASVGYKEDRWGKLKPALLVN